MLRAAVILPFIGLLLTIVPLRAADTLPATLDDATFWRFIANFSEPEGYFRYENLLSNETSYQTVIPALKRIGEPGGAYIGVGPEQNFSYIAALEPKIAFIVDIRQQNMLELLMYKALFETSIDRAEFVSQLFSRNRPPGLDAMTTAQELFKAFESQTCDSRLLGQTLQRVNERLITQHRFPLADDAQKTIKHILDTFCAGGPQIDYGFANAPSNLTAPSYANLMTATDGRGTNWSYLANEDNFRRIREMQLKNLIVPVTGDFAGMKTLRAIGAYLKHHQAAVGAFYVSNVEQYLKEEQKTRFRTNVSVLPVTPSSMLIRFVPPESTVLEPVRNFLFKSGSLFHLLK